MADGTFSLDDIRVASPCNASWDGMEGDARVRNCALCRKHVYDLSGMTRVEAEGLVRGREGRVCVRFFRRADGTVLTADCPVGLRALRRRMALLGTALAASLAVVLGIGAAARAARDGGDGRSLRERIEAFFGIFRVPAPRCGPIMGDIVAPPPTPSLPAPPTSCGAPGGGEAVMGEAVAPAR